MKGGWETTRSKTLMWTSVKRNTRIREYGVKEDAGSEPDESGALIRGQRFSRSSSAHLGRHKRLEEQE